MDCPTYKIKCPMNKNDFTVVCLNINIESHFLTNI